MNVSDYIASGVLQDYCLGILSEEAERNVEAMCQMYPDVASELQLLRMALEKYGTSNKVWQKAELRKSIWETLKKLKDEN
jgi:anti-sigma-K factor RskA